MASAAAAAGGGGNSNSDDDDVVCVYRAVSEGQSAERVRGLIEEYAQGWEERRLEAVNYESNNAGETKGETPLRAAHRRLERGDLVGVLLEAGADVAASFGPYCSPLALAIHHGQLEALRKLLRSGVHGANEKLSGHYVGSGVEGIASSSHFCRPVHLAVVPPKGFCGYYLGMPPKLDALSILVREFGADVNGRDHNGMTPLHWLMSVPRGHRERALGALLSLGADLEVRDRHGWTPIFLPAMTGEATLPQLFLSRGASVDVFDSLGRSPLLHACSAARSPDAVAALVRASSPETRRAVNVNRGGWSAVDFLVDYSEQPWCQDAIVELLSSGAPVLPHKAPRVLSIAARVGERLGARVAALPPDWVVHKTMVDLAFDFQEQREVEAGVGARERQAHELEEQLRAPGVGTEETDEGEEEEEGDEGGKAGGEQERGGGGG